MSRTLAKAKAQARSGDRPAEAGFKAARQSFGPAFSDDALDCPVPSAREDDIFLAAITSGHLKTRSSGGRRAAISPNSEAPQGCPEAACNGLANAIAPCTTTTLRSRRERRTAA